MEGFGVPIQDLKTIIGMTSTDRNKPGVQAGVPKDSLDNQLKEWIYNSRISNIEINDKELQIAIKGDAKEQYPEIKKINEAYDTHFKKLNEILAKIRIFFAQCEIGEFNTGDY
jgi:hypothetical protein